MTIIDTLFSAKGRMRRRDCWLYLIALGVVSFLVKLIAHQFLFDRPMSTFIADRDSWEALQFTPVALFMLAVEALMLWPAICITAKRWHDRNRPGWLAGVIGIGSYVLLIVGKAFSTDGSTGQPINMAISLLANLVGLVIGTWQFIELGFLDGTKGPNQYGPSPKNKGSAEDVF